MAQTRARTLNKDTAQAEAWAPNWWAVPTKAAAPSRNTATRTGLGTAGRSSDSIFTGIPGLAMLSPHTVSTRIHGIRRIPWSHTT